MRITKREHFGIQRKMVSHITTESWRKIPHVTYMYEPDVTAFLEEYKKLNEGREKNGKGPLTDDEEDIIEQNLKDLLDLKIYLLPTLKIETQC